MGNRRSAGFGLQAGALAVALLTVVACGTRRSEQDLAAAAGVAVAGGPVATGGSVLGDAAAGATTDGLGASAVAVDATGEGATVGATAGGPTADGAVGQPGVAAPGAAAAGPQGTINIGSVGSISGLVGSALKPGVDGLRVWVQWVNSRGGLNGHQVNLIVADDQSDPARHRALVQQLVDEQGVVAFVQNAEALSGAGSVSFHQERRIPVIGSEGSNQYWNENSMYFPQMSHGDNFSLGTFAGQAQWAREHGYTRFGQIVCTEASSCNRSLPMARKHAAAFGLEIVYQAQASLAKPDYTAECLNARNAGAQAIGVGLDPNGVSRVAASCARQGYYPAYLIPSASSAPQHLTDPNIREMGTDSPVAPFGSPATAEMTEAFARYLPDVQVTVSHVEGWVAGKLLERAAAGLTEPTSAAILEGLWSIQGDDLGGLTAPRTFSREAPSAMVTCWFVLEGRDGQLVPYADGQRSCTDIEP
jgi:branched-chain amino acid transport system substrate-binding protein